MKKYSHVLFGFLVPLFIMGLIYLGTFLTCHVGFSSNDCFEQYVPFFNQYYEILKHGKSMYYSLSGSMGFDFYAVFSYYLVSPLNFLILPFGKENIVYVINILIILKVALSGGTFAVFLKNRFKDAKNNKIVLFSTIYALSGFTAGYMWNIMWLDGILMFPLVIMGMDILLRDNNPKWYWYTTLLTIQIITSYFIGYMSCIFILMYFFTYHFKNFRDFITKALKIAGASILAIGLSAVILVPAFGGVQSTYISGEVLPSVGLYGNFADSLRTLLLGVPAGGINFNREYANLFITTFAALLAFVYLTTKSVKRGDKIRNLILIGILVLSFNFKPFNFVWHGMHEQTGIPNRFSFMVIFLLLVMAFEVTMKKNGEIKKSNMFAGWGIYTALAAVIAFFRHELIVYALITSAMAMAYVLIMTFVRKAKIKFNIIRIFAMLELVVMLVIGICNSSGSVLGDYSYYLDDFQQINEEKEPGYYREKIDETYSDKENALEEDMSNFDVNKLSFDSLKDFSYKMRNVGHLSVVNEATIYNINSLSLFNTFNNYSQTYFYNKTGATGGTNNVMYYGENAFMDMLLGVRYYYTRYSDSLSSAYEYVKTTGEVDVYRNKYVLSTGYVIPDTLAADEYILVSNVFETMNNISGHIIDSKVFLSKYFEQSDESTQYCKVYTYLSLKDEELLFKINGSDIKTIHAYVNGKEIITTNRNGCIFDIGQIKENDEVIIKVDLCESEKANCQISAATINQNNFDKVYDVLSDNQLEILSYSDRGLNGRITLDEESKVLITIPYSKGWKICVDGKETDSDTLCDLFIVLTLPEGEHEITMKYTSPGVKTGALITAVSIGIAIIAICITIVNKKNSKKKKSEN